VSAVNPVNAINPAQLAVYANAEALAEAAANSFIEQAQAAIAARGRFVVALAGGSTPKTLYAWLASQHAASLDWQRVQVFFGDERAAHPSSPESNFAMAQAALLQHLPASVWRIEGELGAEAACERYIQQLGDFWQTPDPRHWVFDLIHLGLGPDGHTASLFAGDLGHQSQAPVIVGFPVTGLLPQIKRISFGFDLINNARQRQFLVTGASKAAIVQVILGGQSDLPAARIKNASWLLDREAASLIPDRR
jgi:6-phosphogluconolactonase